MDDTLNDIGIGFRALARGQWRFIVACCLFTAATAAGAQQGNRDYYGANLTKSGAHLLRLVEQHHIEPGVRKMRAGSYGFARDDFEFILRYFPNHPRVLALYSELCDVRWKKPLCDTDLFFRKAIEVNERVPETFIINGVHLQRVNRLPEAIESYKRAIALDPASGNAHYNLGLIYVEQKQFELANRHAQLAYALGIQFPGLRDKLTQAGQWTPLDADALTRALTTPDKAPAESSPK